MPCLGPDIKVDFLFKVWTENEKQYTVQACAEDILTFKNGTLPYRFPFLKFEIKATFKTFYVFS